METTILTLRVPQDVKDQPGKLAEASHRSQSFLSGETISRYAELEAWQIAGIQQAIIEADAGDFATEDEVDSMVKKYAQQDRRNSASLLHCQKVAG
ncbi:CopG family ribbon-helix-helix protein [Ferrigenium sp. UT5]|uniref:CopG family ribbon-helix-helix protein n=1 Tax=Ferrigenium sp. UT5 TaxID=3242105 RepID=UPI0038B396FC